MFSDILVGIQINLVNHIRVFNLRIQLSSCLLCIVNLIY
jgi:hypothetical protein